MSHSLIDSYDFQDVPYALQTYYCYVRAWAEKIKLLYGQPTKCFDNMKTATMELKSVQKIQGGRTLDKDIVAAYTRGKLTVKAMETFPIEENRELAPTANLWLPVQAYYAVHGLGLATMVSLGQEMPKDHRAFKAAFSGVAAKYFPKPLNSLCCGGPDDKSFNFDSLDTSSLKVKHQSNLSNPKYADLDCLLGKCLSTTRNRLLAELFNKERHNEVRSGKKRRNLSKSRKQSISDKLHATSVVDFFYRMRIRSNYQEPDIHLYALEQPADEVVRNYSDLLFLTQIIAHSLSFIMRRKIGKPVMDSIETKFQ